MTRAGLRVGLTGGVASGKSAVAARLLARGVPVLDADAIARELTEPGAPALAEIFAALGERFRMSDGALDRRALRAFVFDDSAARRRLEAILHPRIRLRLEERARTSPGPYVVVAVPLLAEVGRYAWMDVVVVVDVARETQLARLLARDGVDTVLAERMLAAQATRAERLAIADYVIANDGTFAELDAAVNALHAQLLLRAAAEIQMPRMPAMPNAPSA